MLKNQFVNTENVAGLRMVCETFCNPSSILGPSLAVVTGPPGRGKTESAKYFSAHTNAIYVPPMTNRTPFMFAQEVVFEMTGEKPGRLSTCLDVIAREMVRERRVIFVDEADLLRFSILEMCRNMNERFTCPIVFIGESGLSGKLAKERRMVSRIRYSMEFGPISPADVSLYFEKAMNVRLSPSDITLIQRHSQGDWRPVLIIAISLDHAMTASDLTEVPEGLIRQIIHAQ